MALGTETNASVPLDGTFEAQLFVFAQTPRPGERVTFRWEIRSATTVKKAGETDLTLSQQQTTPAGNVQCMPIRLTQV